MTFIALDDEPLALVLIDRLARQVPEWELLATFTDAAAAAAYLERNAVDLLLCDINMPDISGLQFVRNLPAEHPMVIFVTAYKEHAHEGFDLEVVDYLVKPVSQERFNKAMGKAAELLELRAKAEAVDALSRKEDHFYVFSEYQQVKIVVPQITYVESMGDYVKIHLDDQPKPVVTLQRLKHLEDKLHDQGFRRIHRSYLVNLARVTAWQKARLQVGDTWLPIGETYSGVVEELSKGSL